MDAQRWQQVKQIFAEVMDRPARERASILEKLCGSDAQLRGEVEALLVAHDSPTSRIEGNIFGRSSDAPPTEWFVDWIGRRVGGYAILGFLAEGGMGAVFRAEQENPKRPVALKMIKPFAGGTQLRARFEHESSILGKLHHPGISQIYEAGVADTTHGPLPFFAMELIDGQPLTAYTSERALNTNQRLELLAAVADAVHYAHQKGVVHRDIKPGNILVDASGQPKVLDFGVARLTDSDVQLTSLHTDAGQIIGTLPYMSPEQVGGDSAELDTRCDIYALGVVGYELLCGRPLYDLRGKSIPEAARIIAEGERTSLSAVDRTLRGDIETIISKALETDKTRRYASAAELAADIRRYLSNKPIEARPAGAWYQARKFAQRNRGLVAGLGATAVAIVLGAVAATWQAVKATNAEGRATKQAIKATQAESKANDSLQREREAKAEIQIQLANSHVQAAQMAAQRGNWQAALDNYEQALAIGCLNDVPLRLGMVEAFVGMGQRPRAVEELKRLEPRTDLGKYKGEMLLWLADNETGFNFVEERTRLINDALEAGLEPADEAYAKGLVAELLPEAIEQFQIALSRNPFHHRANFLLGFSLLFRGRSREAHRRFETLSEMYPEDSSIKLMLAMSYTLTGEPGKGRELLDGLHTQHGSELTAVLDAANQLIAHLLEMDPCAHPQGPKSEQASVALTTLLSTGDAQLLRAVDEELKSIAKDLPTAYSSLTQLPTPRAISNIVGRFMLLVGSTMMGKEQEMLRHMGILAETTSEAMINGLYALSLSKSGRLDEAETIMLRALDLPAIVEVPGLRKTILAYAFAVQSKIARRDNDSATRERALNSLRRMTSMGGLCLFEAEPCSKTALSLNDIELARRILADVEYRFPDDPTVMRMKARIDYRAGAYGPAILAADAALETNPDDPEMQKIRADALASLGMIGEPDCKVTVDEYRLTFDRPAPTAATGDE